MKKVYCVEEAYFDKELCYWQSKILGYFSKKQFATDYIKGLPKTRQVNVICTGRNVLK
jgi:hypothetical protein